MRYVTMLILILSLFSSRVHSQEMYSTQTGSIQIKFSVNDSAVLAYSKQLIVVLNYETADFILTLDKSTLKTGIDSLDKKLERLKGEILRYEGKMDIDYIDTESHPPQDFEVEGFLNCAPHYHQILGKGHLEHIFSGTYSCILNISFHINLDDLDISLGVPGIGNTLHVEIIQTVLDREYNKE